MMVCLLLLAIIHPGRSLQGPDSRFPKKSRKEKKAAKQAKKDEKAMRKEAKKSKGHSHVEMNRYPPEYTQSDSSVQQSIGHSGH